MTYAKLSKQPTDGEYEQVLFDNHSECQYWHWLKFNLGNENDWVGAFRSGNVLKNLIVSFSETENTAIIVSGGAGYLINFVDRRLIKILGTSLITAVTCDFKNKNFIVADFYGITVIGEDFEEKNYGSPIEADGLKFDKVKNRKLPLIITDAADMRSNIDYCFDLDTLTFEKM